MGHTGGEWSARCESQIELPGHAQILWACLVHRGALGQTGESPTSPQAAPLNPLSFLLSPCCYVLSPRTQAGLQLEEEATDPELGSSQPSTELCSRQRLRCESEDRMGASEGLWHHVTCSTRSEL